MKNASSRAAFRFLFLASCFLGSSPALATDYNVTSGPFGLLMGAPNVRVDLVCKEDWVIGPEAGFFQIDIGEFNVRAAEFRVSLGHYFSGNFDDSYFAAPFVAYRTVKVTSDVDDVKASLGLVGAVAGYHWFWDSFNIRTGAGIVTGLGSARVKIINDMGVSENVTIVPSLSIDIAFGFTF